MESPLLRDEVVDVLWGQYRKSHDYKSGKVHAIPSFHPLVEQREALGSKRIYQKFILNYNKRQSIRNKLRNRTISAWLDEWKLMHKTLFDYILKKRGEWRDCFVRFGDYGDEELHHIPSPSNVPREMMKLANDINKRLNNIPTSLEDKYSALASIHYQFIRIHPFEDGNGRIARALTDQVSMYFGLPPAVEGYPRHDSKRREKYHSAIKACVYDASHEELKQWISSYISTQLKEIA